MLSDRPYKLVRSLLPSERVNRLLEIGRRDFMSLAQDASEVLDFELRRHGEAAANVSADGGDGTRLPFPDRYFDVIVSGDALTMAPNPSALCVEMDRVLDDDGRLIVVIPALRWFGEAAVHTVLGNKSERYPEDARRSLMPMLQRHFEIETSSSSPKVLPMYRAFRLHKIGPGTTLNLWTDSAK